jgi:hypothetical protein
MMAGPTTQVSTPIGTVTDAQMARIFAKEYCLVSAGPRPAQATAVCLSRPQRCAKGGLCRSAISPGIAACNTPRG